MVCIGNICRSPVAEGFILHYFKNNSIAGEVSSAGIYAMVGNSADPHAQTIMRDQFNIDVSQHRARQITKEMVQYYDLVLAMDQEQVTILKKKYPFALGKIYSLGKWRQVDIADPYQQSEVVFYTCIDLIQACVMDWIKKY